MDIILHHIWRYVGPGEGCGAFHKIIAVERDTFTVITTSLGHSWMGSAREFLQNFQWVEARPR